MNAGKVLIGFALLCLIIWCVVGFYIGSSSEGYHQKMAEYAGNRDLEQFWATFSAWKSHTVAHAHGLCLSMVAFLIGLSMAVRAINVSKKFSAALTIVFIAGIALASVADWFGVVPLVIIGDTLFIIALVAAFVGLFIRPTKASPDGS